MKKRRPISILLVAVGMFVLIASDELSSAEETLIQASVTPTVFYRRSEEGLVEVVEVIARFNRKISTGQVFLDFNGRHYSAALSPAPDAGEQRVQFEVPEWSGPQKGFLRVQVGGATRNFDMTLVPQRKWIIFVVPLTHLDVGYHDYQGKVAEGGARLIAQGAELIREHPGFRFSIDGSWSLEEFLLTRSAEKQKRILELIRQGKIGLPAQYCNLLTGYASLETLFRSLYYSKALTRRYGLPFQYVNITDVPSYTGAYLSVLASAGIEYWIAGGNDYRAPFLHYGQWDEKSPFWWEGSDGKKVLFWHSLQFPPVQRLFQLPPRSGGPDSLPVFLRAYSKPQYKPDAVLIYGENLNDTDLPVPSSATIGEAWNLAYAYPKLQYATFDDFSKYIEEHYGGQLETYRGDGGPYWEDGVGSDAYYTAEDRRNQNRALSAEVLSALAHMLDPALGPRKDLLEDIWRNILLFAEHTWGSHLSVGSPDHEWAVKQLEFKDNYATAARLEIDGAVQRSMSQLAEQVHISNNTLVVFNSLSWRRDALVEMDLYKRAVLKDLNTGRNVSYEVLWVKEGFQHARFLAKDLPAVGYKCYAISYPKEAPAVHPAPETTHAAVIENAFYRVTLDPSSGAVASIYDKELKREIVDSRSPYKFDQYLYVRGGDGKTRIIHPDKTWLAAQLQIHPASGGEILSVAKTPFGHSIRLRSQGLHTPNIQTEILLFDGEKQIEFINRVEKDPVRAKEGVYFAFPVALEKPQFVYATQNGWVNPARDLLKGASLEWFSVQYWMVVRDNQLTVGIVPLDAPLASFGDINRGLWPSEFQPESSTIFSYVMNNYWDTNYRASQGGEFTFRYVLTSGHDFDPQALTQSAWSYLRPAEINYVMPPHDKYENPDRPLPPEGASFLEIDQPDVTLVTWKCAEDGSGTILRLHEIAGRETVTTLRFLRVQVRTAYRCNAVEDNISALSLNGNSLQVTLRPHEVATLRIQ